MTIFKEKKLSDVLNWIPNIKRIKPIDIKRYTVEQGEKYPFYGQQLINNGVVDYISVDKRFLNNKEKNVYLLIASNNHSISIVTTPFYIKEDHAATSTLGHPKELIITDNGDGINYDELGETFGAFLASKKNLLSLKMKSKANKGKGRFSFIAFADKAEWCTVYKDKDDYKEYQITMSNDTKEVIDCSQPESSDRKESGTSVRFSDINTLTAENMSFEILEPALLKEFAWFLYLYKSKNVEITVNGDKVDFEKYVNTKLSEKSMVTIDGHRFEISLVVWQESIKEKFCCYYFDSEDALKGKDTTNLLRNHKVIFDYLFKSSYMPV